MLDQNEWKRKPFPKQFTDHFNKRSGESVVDILCSSHWTSCSLESSMSLFLPSLAAACLLAGVRLPSGSCRKLTAWIRKASPCLVEHIMFSNVGNKWKIGWWFRLCYFWVCWIDMFRLIMWPCSNTSSGAICSWDTTCWAIFLLALSSFAEKSLLESLDSSLALDSWALLLRLSTKPSIFKPDENVTVCFLNIFTQISPKNYLNTGSMISQHAKSTLVYICIYILYHCPPAAEATLSKGKVTQREREFCTLNWLLLVYK